MKKVVDGRVMETRIDLIVYTDEGVFKAGHNKPRISYRIGTPVRVMLEIDDTTQEYKSAVLVEA